MYYFNVVVWKHCREYTVGETELKNKYICKNIHTMKIFRKLYPFFLAVICFNIIILLADFTNHDIFWSDSFLQNWIAFVFLTLYYYLFDFSIQWFIKKRRYEKRSHFDTARDYAIVVLSQPIVLTLLLFLGGKTGVLFFGNPAMGCIVVNIVSVPILTLYFTALSWEKIESEYNNLTLQLEKTKSNQLETELKYLRAQYHPHFLFNALNTVYFQIDDQNTNAKNTVELLSELLRYQLYNMEKVVDISEEINFIKRYIHFQQLRMTKRLAMTAYFDEALDKQKVYPLIYQPFLENAFKYVGGEYWITIQLTFYEETITFCIENSLPEEMQQTKKSSSGIGIENIKRRLALLYPDRHSLNIRQDEKSFVVELIITPDTDEN